LPSWQRVLISGVNAGTLVSTVFVWYRQRVSIATGSGAAKAATAGEAIASFMLSMRASGIDFRGI
jgi:hypothetical protein